MKYRLEVSKGVLSEREQRQFRSAARAAGFYVYDDGFNLSVFGLREAQACTLRDGLIEMGKHCSLGIDDRDVDGACSHCGYVRER